MCVCRSDTSETQKHKKDKRLNGYLEQPIYIIEVSVEKAGQSSKDDIFKVFALGSFETTVYKYNRTSIIQISIIRTLGYLNTISNFKIPKDDLTFCKTK